MKQFFTLLFTCSVSLFVAQNACSVNQLPLNLQNGLLAFYPFCGTTNDVTSNSNNATGYNTVLTTDRFGNLNSAYSLNGTNAYLKTNTSFFSTNLANYTISGWFMPSDTLKLEQSLLNTIPHNNLAIGYNYTGSWKNHCIYSLNSNPANSSWNVVLGKYGPYTNFKKNNWHHVVLVRNGATWKQYINGVLDDTFTSSSSFSASNYPLIFGAILYPSNGTPGEFFKGKLDDYSIYNRSLTDSEITELFSATTSVAEITEQTKLNVFPNPSNGSFIIECENEKNVNYKINIIDIVGQSLYSQQLFEGKNNINLPVSKGVYAIIILDAEQNQVAQKRIVIE